MPAPIAATRLRAPHARMIAALHLFAAHLTALNDPIRSPGAALAAAADLAAELLAWRRVAGWLEACRTARVRWPVPPQLAISPILRPETAGNPEHLPNTAAGQRHHPAAGLRAVHQLRQQQAELDLAPPPSAELVDLRQLPLPLHRAAA